VFILNKVDLIPTSVAVSITTVTLSPSVRPNAFVRILSASLPSLEDICYSVGKSNIKLAVLLFSDLGTDWVPFWDPLISLPCFTELKSTSTITIKG